jgi:serine/threonine protein phosphatase PrpC
VILMEQLKAAYANYRWFRLATWVGLLLCGFLLYQASGGFPPWAWRFSAQVFPQTTRLWAQQGPAILPPLIGLALLSTALLILWGVLVSIAVRMVLYWWQNIAAHRHFEQELQEAEALAERMVEHVRREDYSEQQKVPVNQRQQVPVARASRFERNSVPHETSSQPAVGGQVSAERLPASIQAIPLARGGAPAERFAAPTGIPERPVAAERFATASPHLHFNGAAPQPQYNTSYGGRGGNVLPALMNAPVAPPRPPVERSVPSRGQVLPVQTTASSAMPSVPSAVRNQLRMVPPVEGLPESDNYDTLPFLENERDIEQQPTLPTTDTLEEEDEQEGMLRLVVGIGLDPGIVRKDAPNEDNLLAMQGMHEGKEGSEPVGLFVVADGMGGHADGQVASRLAIQSISDVVAPALLRSTDDEVFSDLLKDGAHRANLAIYRRNRQQEHMMGTTLTAALVIGTQAHVVNVGDSRTYLYRPSEGLRQVTRDHSVVAQMVEKGLIAQEEIYTHPRRNQIYRCLGDQASVELDAFEVTLQAGDILLLCSDGLWEMVHDPDIERIISASAPHASQISTMLIQAALTRGGADNIGVVVVCLLHSRD